jgi:uncharacterized protein YdbL (DUF1318 family)
MKKVFALAFTAIALLATAPLASAMVRPGQSVQDITGGWYGPGQSLEGLTVAYKPGQSVQDITGGWYGPAESMVLSYKSGQSVQDITGGW